MTIADKPRIESIVPTLPVTEIFVSMQGEGPRAGRTTTFIRLGGCNLSCSWCDTPYTWDATRFNLRKEFHLTGPGAIAKRIDRLAHEVCITGGEPLIHQEQESWGQLLTLLHQRGQFVTIETNGTIAPNDVTRRFVGHYSISPKLPNAGPHRGHQDPEMAAWPMDLRLGRQVSTCLKFVCADAHDVRAALTYAVDHQWPVSSVWVMPLGATREELENRWRIVADEAVRLRVNATHRLHVLAWGDRRGT